MIGSIFLGLLMYVGIVIFFAWLISIMCIFVVSLLFLVFAFICLLCKWNRLENVFIELFREGAIWLNYLLIFPIWTNKNS